MRVSNRLYYTAVLLGILVIILGGVWIYKQLKEFTTIPQKYTHQNEIGDRIEEVTEKKDNSSNNYYTNETATNTIVNEVTGGYTIELNLKNINGGVNEIDNNKTIIY